MKDWKFIFEKWILRQHRPGFFEPKVKRKLRGIRGRLFVDIGANRGLYTILLHKHFDSVIAFEPDPKVVQFLQERVVKSEITNVRVFSIAVGASIGKTILYNDPRIGNSTILKVFDYNPNVVPGGGSREAYVGAEGIEVPVSTYDALVQDPADLVKIDVEGAEFLVLEGMKKSLEAHKVKRLVVELHDRSRKTELERILGEYAIDWIDPDHLIAVSRQA